MLKNRSMPQATVIPEVAYRDIGEAIRWLTEVFGFRVRIRMGDHRAQMNVGDGAVMLVMRDGDDLHGRSLMVRVGDVDRHCAQALAHGAKVTREPKDYPYGERQYTVEDFAENRWTFSESIADVDPKEWGGEADEL